MGEGFKSAFLIALALSSAGVSHAYADVCRDELSYAQEGMIDIREPARPETLSSREALDMLGDRGERTRDLSFQRVVPDFWRRKVRSHVEPHDLVVRYQVIGGGDRTGHAAHEDNPGQRFAVRLIPSQLKVLCENSEYRIISGGFTALARAQGIGLAGLYALEIDVDVQER